MPRPGKLIEAQRRAKREGWDDWIKSSGDESAMLRGCYFSIDHALHFKTFVEEYLVLTKGRWAGQPAYLTDWQWYDLCGPLFGWLRPDGTRRYRRGYCELPKKNAKTTSVSFIGNYMLFGDGEPGAECYAAANDKDQAALVWAPAADMVEASPRLAECSVVHRSSKAIMLGSSSWFKAWSADAGSKDGPDIHFCSVDELHSWKAKGRELWEKIKYGGTARRQPICPLVITTAGSSKNTLCGEQHDYAERVISGRQEDYSFLGVLYRADPKKVEEDPNYWKTEDAFREANPSYEIIISRDVYEEHVAEAEANPAEAAAYKRYHLNIWTRGETPWISEELWSAQPKLLNETGLYGGYCCGAIDLSRSTDLCPLVWCFPLQDGTFAFTWRIYCPEETLIKRSKQDNVRYDLWAEQGHIVTTPGPTVDYAFIEEQIYKDCSEFDVDVFAYDPWNAKDLVQRLENNGVTAVAMRQGYATMSPACKAFYKALLEKSLRIRGNTCADWCSENVVIEQDPAGNIKPSKAKSTERIDPIVAAVMAFYAVNLRQGEGESKSVYEERGLRTLDD